MVVQEILVLTKMNLNAEHFEGLQLITLKFSQLVSDVLKEIPKEREPVPKYKYYT